MDESLQELENELKRLTPRAPRAALHEALARELDGETVTFVAAPESRASASGSLPGRKWAVWALAGVTAAAAALVVSLTMRRAEPVAPEGTAPAVVQDSSAQPSEDAAPALASGNRYEPVHASSVLYDLQESAPTLLPDRTEGREVRYRYVDTYTWKNPTTNASLRWSVPRDEVRLVRTNFN